MPQWKQSHTPRKTWFEVCFEEKSEMDWDFLKKDFIIVLRFPRNSQSCTTGKEIWKQNFEDNQHIRWIVHQ